MSEEKIVLSGKFLEKLKESIDDINFCYLCDNHPTSGHDKDCPLAEPLCQHKQVTVYDRLVSFQTYYEPAEYDFKITCDECDEEFNEIPEGSESKEEPWEADTPDWDYGL